MPLYENAINFNTLWISGIVMVMDEQFVPFSHLCFSNENALHLTLEIIHFELTPMSVDHSSEVENMYNFAVGNKHKPPLYKIV